MPDPGPLPLDRRLSRVVLVGLVAVVGYYVWLGAGWLVDWIATWPPYGPVWWSNLAAWAGDWAGVVVVVYTVLCVNAAGVAELKLRKPFLKALGLALLLTPPVMIGAWARRR